VTEEPVEDGTEEVIEDDAELVRLGSFHLTTVIHLPGDSLDTLIQQGIRRLVATNARRPTVCGCITECIAQLQAKLRSRIRC